MDASIKNFAALDGGAMSVIPRRPSPNHENIPSLVSSGYVRIVPDRLADHLRRMLAADEAQIHARDLADPDSLIVVAMSGGDPELVGSRVPAHQGVVGLALQMGQPVVAPGELGAAEGEPAAAAAPVARDGRLAGVVSVTVRDSARSFDLGDVERLCELADLAGGALERPARKALELTADAQAAALATAVELWDDAIGPHSLDVVALARQMGRALSLSRSELLELELAARLHDVGKIRVPRELLLRPARLTPDEREVVELHATWGAELLAQVPGMAAVALAVLHHHERVDGCGYPAGLVGDQIPLASRIIAVADAYATMVRGRCYRNPIPAANAVEELRVHSGKQFDARVVDALVEVAGARGVVVPLPVPVSA
jgi:HD-GYP domain-containing protein (c-di-GMP phosphodiesterase class II)